MREQQRDKQTGLIQSFRAHPFAYAEEMHARLVILLVCVAGAYFSTQAKELGLDAFMRLLVPAACAWWCFYEAMATREHPYSRDVLELAVVEVAITNILLISLTAGLLKLPGYDFFKFVYEQVAAVRPVWNAIAFFLMISRTLWMVTDREGKFVGWPGFGPVAMCARLFGKRAAPALSRGQVALAYAVIAASVGAALMIHAMNTKKTTIFIFFFAAFLAARSFAFRKAKERARIDAQQERERELHLAQLAEAEMAHKEKLLQEQARAAWATAADQEELARLRATGGTNLGPRLRAAIEAAKMAKEGASRNEISRWLEKNALQFGLVDSNGAVVNRALEDVLRVALH